MLQADVAIIGAGIAGLTVARELARYRLRVVVLEKEIDAATGSTKASSSIIHADYGAPGSATARLTVEGNRLFDDLCRELSVPFYRCGVLFVAFEGEEPILNEIVESAEANGAVPFQRLGREEVLKLESNLNPDLTAGALGPSGGVLNSFELAIALFENARDNGVEFLLGTKLISADETPGGNLVLETDTGHKVRTRFVVNAAGLFADRVADILGDADHLKVVPQRGQEVILDQRSGPVVRRVIFDCGTGLVVPTVHGNLLLGTTKEETQDKAGGLHTTRQGVDSIVGRARKLIPGLDPGSVIRSFAGLRACNNREDHFIGRSERVPSLVTVSLQTGGLTASPAAAREAVELLEEAGLNLEPKGDFEAHREPMPVFREMSPAEQAEMIRRDSRFGRMVCRCETVTEGEIVEAVRRGARSVDGVKYRVRAGMGRCQGGFCGPRVMAILARELGVTLNDVTKRGKDSWLVRARAGR